MRIKQININDQKLSFRKSDDIIFIEDEDPIGNVFMDAINNIFCDTKINVDCVSLNNYKLKCIVEIYGTTFTIKVKAAERKLSENNCVFGSKGRFELSCSSDFVGVTVDKDRLIRSCKGDFREVFMPFDTTRQIVFFDKHSVMTEYTDPLISHYRQLLEWTIRSKTDADGQKDKSKQDGYLSTLVKQCSEIERFICEFKDIDLGFARIGFDKKTGELKTPKSDNRSELGVISFCDFITANRLNSLLQSITEKDGRTPVFVIDCFQGLKKSETEFFLKQLRSLYRQVFIIDGRNPFLQTLCDKTIVIKNDSI